MKKTTLGRISKPVVLTIGGVVIVAGFFFGTLLILDYLAASTLQYPDSVRAAHATSLKAALERYRSAQGSYPSPFPDNPVTDLKKQLVDGKYLDSIPKDPDTNPEIQYHYVSNDGKAYGLLFRLKFAAGKVPAGGSCLTGIGTARSGWWGQPPDCPF
jgi:hypothetical protein